jgi:hypothetical protein
MGGQMDSSRWTSCKGCLVCSISADNALFNAINTVDTVTSIPDRRVVTALEHNQVHDLNIRESLHYKSDSAGNPDPSKKQQIDLLWLRQDGWIAQYD